MAAAFKLLCPTCQSVLEEKDGGWWRCDQCKVWLPGVYVRAKNEGAIHRGRPRKEKAKTGKRGKKSLASQPQTATIVVENDIMEVPDTLSGQGQGGQSRPAVTVRGKRRPKGCDE